LQRQEALRQAQRRHARAIVDYLLAATVIETLTGDLLDTYGIELAPASERKRDGANL